MKKPYTMKDGKTRDASCGPWVSLSDVAGFVSFCRQNGHAVREAEKGYQVQHQGHWMGLVWNSGFKRYTADRRLSSIAQSFAAAQRGGNSHNG